MAEFTSVDLSRLPAPNVVETVDFETIVSEMLAELREKDSTFDALVESDPAYKILEVAAYREMLVRERVNASARAVMLAYARGADLDHIGANEKVPRLVLQEGDPEASPPVPRIMEEDDDYRERIQLRPEGSSTAGPRGAYIFHGRAAHPDVKDVQPIASGDGEVTVYVLSRQGDGEASESLLTAVEEALSDEDVRPLTDHVLVESATIVTYEIEAELVLFSGPDDAVVKAQALKEAQAYVAAMHRIGLKPARSGMYRALHQPGVARVNLTSPASDIEVDDGEAAYCTAIDITSKGLDDDE